MLSIIVPYRDRKDHLDQFIPHMNNYLPDAKIFIVEQADDKAFNRGKLLNCGFLESWSDEYVFHDVDMLPFHANYYPNKVKGMIIKTKPVVQLIRSNIQTMGYLGGVTYFTRHCFEKIGGFHNEFWHRAEDNEQAFNLKRLGIPVYNHFGSFRQLPHPRTGPEFIPELWQKAQLPRNFNMLETCKYELISKEVHPTHTHIKVLL